MRVKAWKWNHNSFNGRILRAITIISSTISELFFLPKNKYVSIAVYLILPIVFTIFVWPITAAESTWFAWVKTYSALAGVLGFMAFRHIKSLQKKKLMILFPGFILVVNILEAIVRDFEVYGLSGADLVAESLQPGPWNIINGVAGILLVLSMSGFLSVKVANTKSKDMIWADQTWFWIIAYDLWNFSFCYNTIPLRSFYTGPLLNLTPVFISFFMTKGAWLQNRAQTLALFAMFSLLVPKYANLDIFSITTTGNPNAMMAMSLLSLAANLTIFVYAIIRIIKSRKNPLTNELYTHLNCTKEILQLNNI